jgi:hypothetical protein
MLSYHLKKVAQRLLVRGLDEVARHRPGRLITRNDSKDPYFYRYYLTEERPEAVTVLLHKFVGSDPLEEVHSHPWEWGVSLILSGGYVETRYKAGGFSRGAGDKVLAVDLRDRELRIFQPGDINVIHGDTFHRVEITQPTWTLFVHGPRKSTWGFANDRTGAFREITRRTIDFPEVNQHLKAAQ